MRGVPAGSLPPRILEKGACHRRAPARGRRKLFVALGITPHSPGPRAGERTQPSCRALPAPFLVRRLWPLAGLGGHAREMGAWVMLSEPFRPRPSSRDPTCWARSRLGLQRPGRPGPEATRRLRTYGRGARQQAALVEALSCHPRPPSPPPEDVSSSGHRRLARGCGGGGRRAARCLGRPEEGARARPPPCPPLPPLPPPPRPVAPDPSWAARAARPRVPPLPRRVLSLAAQPEPRSLVALQTLLAPCAVHRREQACWCPCVRVYMCTRQARACRHTG